MALSTFLFLTATVLPAGTFFVYAFTQFLREALRMRSERLSAMRFTDESESLPASARGRASVIEFLPNPRRHSQRGAA
jgi:hypothetical protein